MRLPVRLIAFASRLRESYWALPGGVTLGLALAGLLMVSLDTRLGTDWLGRFDWLYRSRPEGARAVLSTVASSTVTVAGVVFSITIAALTYASGQHGPRLLRHFNRDRGNQLTLGVFLGTFLYCLVVLRTIRSAAEASAETGGAVRDAFVPYAAVLGAMGLAALSIAMLVFFVHNVTEQIQIDSAVANIGRGLLDRLGEAAGSDDAPSAFTSADRAAVEAMRTGYFESVDLAVLARAAGAGGYVVRLTVRPGDFLHAGRTAAEVVPAQAAAGAAAAVDASFSIGDRRTAFQDLRFAVNELVEVAARALSPGVNDPFTAVACLDWLGAATSDRAAMPDADILGRDAQGVARALLPGLPFPEFLAIGFGGVRAYAVEDDLVRAHGVQTLEAVERGVADPTHRALVAAERQRWRASA